MYAWIKNLFKREDNAVYHYYSGRALYVGTDGGRRSFIETLYKTDVKTGQTYRLRMIGSGQGNGSWVPSEKPKWYEAGKLCATPYWQYNTLNVDYHKYLESQRVSNT